MEKFTFEMEKVEAKALIDWLWDFYQYDTAKYDDKEYKNMAIFVWQIAEQLKKGN